ncbi:MAG: glycosyltransferase family 4 protein [Anaerolineae bacterium]
MGLNAHLLSLTQSYRGAGINGYIYQLLRHLPQVERGEEAVAYVAFLYEPAFRPSAGLQVQRSRWDTRSPWRRIVWEQTSLAASARHLDLLHGLAFAAPLLAPCTTVVTVHDLSFMRFPDAFRRGNRIYLTLFTRLSTRRAARVIAVSESTRRDVIALCGVAPEQVVTIHNGVDTAFCPAEPAAVAAFRQAKGLPERFILFLGTLEPRKNLDILLHAYARLRARLGAGAPKLMIAGGKGWFYETVLAQVDALGLADDVYFPGYVAGDELPWWYRAAELFVYPSRFEGFGLPVLEAMACGTPVITTTSSSLPEVAGDAALLVDPDDVDGLTGALERLLTDASLRASLRQAGLQRAAQFSWARTAAETARLYRDVLGLPRPGGGE